MTPAELAEVYTPEQEEVVVRPLPPLFRRTGSVGLVTHLFLMVGSAAVLLSVYYSGELGILHWLAIVPVVAVLLTGLRAEVSRPSPDKVSDVTVLSAPTLVAR